LFDIGGVARATVAVERAGGGVAVFVEDRVVVDHDVDVAAVELHAVVVWDARRRMQVVDEIVAEDDVRRKGVAEGSGAVADAKNVAALPGDVDAAEDDAGRA
jgi:hypothetical protein